MKEILIYGDIGPWGAVDPTRVVQELQAAKGQPINLRILSDGGDVFSGLAIYNYLRGIPDVTASVDGLAASIASVIMLGARRVTMPENGFVMVHNPTGVALGDEADMRDLADLLGRTGGQMAGIYARETGQDQKTATDWMSKETWFDANQALAAGLIDEITEPVVLQAKFNLGRFTRTPTALLNQLVPRPKEGTPMTKLLDALRELKLIDVADTEEEAIVAKFRTGVAGLAARRDELEALLQTGLETRAKAAIEAAVTEGRISKDVKAEFVAAYLRDEPGTVSILASIPKPTGSGTDPVRFGGSSDRTSLGQKIEAEPDPRKRVWLRARNWEELAAERH